MELNEDNYVSITEVNQSDEFADDDTVLEVGKRILNKHRKAFEELAK